MRNVTVRRLFLAMIAIVATLAAAAHAAPVRTLNIDFGNAGAYSGDDGILSSPGGTFWNEVTIGAGTFNIPGLRDEFGASLPVDLLAQDFSATAISVPSAMGPLNDGVLVSNHGGYPTFAIRVLSSATPIEVVIYFNAPASNMVLVNPLLGQTGTGILGFAIGSGPFPGVRLGTYARFQNLSPVGTTLGFDLLPGILIDVPRQGLVGGTFIENNAAGIAAIQIRGEFVPEPIGAPLLLAALCVVDRTRRFRRAPELTARAGSTAPAVPRSAGSPPPRTRRRPRCGR
jgi:hypothetical protein